MDDNNIETYLKSSEYYFRIFDNGRKASDPDSQKMAFTAIYFQNRAIIELLKQELKQIDEMKEYVSSLQHQLLGSKVPYVI